MKYFIVIIFSHITQPYLKPVFDHQDGIFIFFSRGNTVLKWLECNTYLIKNAQTMNMLISPASTQSLQLRPAPGPLS